MKEYLILKGFDGSQNGIDSDSFVAGTTRELSDSLVQALGGTNGGYVKEAGKAAAEIEHAPTELADAVREAIAGAGVGIAEGEAEKVEQVYLDDQPIDPNLRDTKVVEPDETKPGKPFAKKGKK